MNYDTLEYSVCEDCLLFIANDDVPEDKEHSFYIAKINNELDGKEGHFVCGIEPTEDDPEGNGYDEFSWQACELCRSSLGGSRHGVTLLIKLPEEST